MAVILIVDDEPDLRDMMRFVLEAAGHTVVEAPHGRLALERMRERPIDLVITDVMMPVMGGAELIERLRDSPQTSAIPVIVVSGSAHGPLRADRVMRKPFDPRYLREQISALLVGRAS